MNHNTQEILIQRCVDNECTSDERRELMRHLDETSDGWKTLACTYMEEQLFAAGCRPGAATSPASVNVAPAESRKHWFHHPSVSMILTACVVFLLGVIGAGEYERQKGNDVQSLAETYRDPIDSKIAGPPPGSIGRSRNVGNQPQDAWVQADGMNAAKVPVYSKVSEFIPSLEEFRQQGNQRVERFGSRVPRPRIRYIRVQMGDDLLLLPVEELSFEQNMQ